MELEKMQNSSRHVRSSSAQKQRRSGYEPSDTETERHDIPSRDRPRKNLALAVVDEPKPKPNAKSDMERNISPLNLSRRNDSKFEEFDSGSVSNSKTSPVRWRQSSKSPYRKNRDDAASNQYPKPSSEFRRHLSPLPKAEHLSPIRNGAEDRKPEAESKQSRRTPSREERGKQGSQSRRSATAPRLRIKENTDQQQQRSPPPRRNPTRSQTSKPPTGGQINEMFANVKLSRIQGSNKNMLAIMDSTESIQAGDIFFSREVTAPVKQSNGNSVKTRGFDTNITSSSPLFTETPNLPTNMNRNPDQRTRRPSSRHASSSSVTSRPGNGKLNRGNNSNASSYSGISSSISMGVFTAQRRKKSQSEPWFACGRNGSCAKSRRTPEKERFDEASFIERAFIVEKLRPFWADKYQPNSLAGLTCHKQEALLLKQLASSSNIPHILFKGPYGSGKRALTMGFLSQIYGDQCFNLSHELRHFQVQEKRPVDVIIPLTSSAHHVELNVYSEANARYALMGIVKEISNNHDMTPEVSTLNFKPDYKVIVLREVDRAGESIQHMIKWIMDCYADSCKLVLCCEDDGDILESVKDRCKVIKVDAPVTHEIIEVLIQIARKEEFNLPMSFAAKIATKSKQNMRKAIMALEACKAHNYPFSDDQPIQIGWEDVLVELAAEILSDPSPKRLFSVRGKFQKLLQDFVHPKLILQKLVEQFLKGISSDLKREVYYWHAYYDKRLPAGSSALLKLEEFVAKFISICRKSTSNNQLKAANRR